MKGKLHLPLCRPRQGSRGETVCGACKRMTPCRKPNFNERRTEFYVRVSWGEIKC